MARKTSTKSSKKALTSAGAPGVQKRSDRPPPPPPPPSVVKAIEVIIRHGIGTEKCRLDFVVEAWARSKSDKLAKYLVAAAMSCASAEGALLDKLTPEERSSTDPSFWKKHSTAMYHAVRYLHDPQHAHAESALRYMALSCPLDVLLPPE